MERGEFQIPLYAGSFKLLFYKYSQVKIDNIV